MGTSGEGIDSNLQPDAAMVTGSMDPATAFAALRSASQLDKLGERLKKGPLDRELMIALAGFRNRFIPSTEAVAKRIRDTKRPYSVDITQRPAKSTASIIAKLRREHSRLSQIQDIGGLRLVVSKTSVQEKAVQLVRRLYPDSRYIDRREKPQHGYRAVHVIVREGECIIEVQIRTKLQNGWAQYSEKLGDVHGNEIKYGSGDAVALSQLAYLSNGVRQIEGFEANADLQKSAMNVLQRKLREGAALTDAERQLLESYQRLRQSIRAVRRDWLRYFRDAAA